MLLDAFGLFEIFCWGLEAIHFRAQADELTRRDRFCLALKFSEFAAVVVIILWKFRIEITRVVEIQTVIHVGIQIVTPDLATQAVRIGEQNCTAICVFGLEVIVVKKYMINFEIFKIENPTAIGLFRVIFVRAPAP